VVGGLAGTDTVSLESVNFPGYYVRHKSFEVWLDSAAPFVQAESR
jgi:hypothetical protein